MEVAANIRWHVPEGVDAEQVLRSGFAMMDGVQLRWLRVPGRDLNEMWASCEDVLFPLHSGRLPLTMKYLLAPDSFKEAASAQAVAESMRRGVAAGDPGAECRMMPLSDGGEGLTDALVQATGGELRSEHAHDALGRPIITRYGFLGEGGFGTSHDGENPRTAVVELLRRAASSASPPPTAIRWRRPLSAPAS